MVKKPVVVAKKGKRGKKICKDCEAYVPIHSQKCPECQHQFHLNHKPKKVKQLSLGEMCYKVDRVNWHRGCSLILFKCKAYGFSQKYTQD